MGAPDRSCVWPGCQVLAPTVKVGAKPWHCLTHVDDSFLPHLIPGPVGACARCGQRTVHWLDPRRDPEWTRVVVPLHVGCRRAWAEGRHTIEPKGAYARRRRHS